MKVFLLFHDAALPHSRYLLEGFAAHPRVSELTVAYPEGRGSDLIFSAGADGGLKTTGYTMVGLKSSWLRPKWVRFSSLLSAIRTAKPDYVVVLDEALYPNTLLSGIAIKCLGLNVPVVFYGFENIHQQPPWQWLLKNGVKALWPFVRKTLRYYLFDRGLQPIRGNVVSGGLVSYSECDLIVRKAGWQALMGEQWWGVDTQLFQEAAAAESTRPSAWQVPEACRVIGFVGRFVPEKGLVDLLNALVTLGSDYALVCIGGGPQESELREMAIALGVDSRFQILPPMPGTALAVHVAAMDVLALPSHTEQFWKEQYGRVLVEAMAAGIPVVGSDSGAIPYVIGEPNRVFIEGDITGICDAVRVAVAMTPEERRALQVRAQRGDVSAFVQAYVDFYDQLRLAC